MMTIKSILRAASIFISVISFNASAALVSKDLYLVGDGLITLDTVSGLEWLDLSQTSNTDYANAETNNPGWRYATNAEVENLFSIAFSGFVADSPNDTATTAFGGGYPNLDARASDFTSLFGPCRVTTDYFYTYGVYRNEGTALSIMGANVSDTYGYSQVLGIDYPAAVPGPNPENGIFLVRESAVSPPPTVTFLAPGWEATDFLTLGIPTRAIAFDSSDNLYVEDTSDDNSGTIDVLQLSAASGYTDSTSYVSYSATHNSITYKGVTGLGFDVLNSLYVAERDAFGDAGIIREIDVATQTLTGVVMEFANHRPTGVGADTSGNVFYSGRKESSGIWGKIFKIDTNVVPAERTELIPGTVATGIAVDTLGNIFISTPERTDLPLQRNSIYRYAANDLLNPELIATFDARGGELTFDAAGNLYMVADDKVNIIKLSKIAAKAMPWLPLLLE